MNQQATLTSAALYARVSSDRQDVDLSVAAQLRALRDYAEKNGYVIAREYIDEAESGRIANGPQFRRMLDEASRADSPFQEILVWKFSKPKPRWDVHLPWVGIGAGIPAEIFRPLIAGWCGSGA